MNNAHQKLERINTTLSRTSNKSSTMYNRIKAGVFPPPVSTGGQTVAWISAEVDQWIKAVIVGTSDEEMKALVTKMLESR